MRSNSGKQKASRQKRGKWEVGKQCKDNCIEPRSPVAQPEWKWHGQDWHETSNFRSFKLSLSLKMECRDGIFWGKGLSLGQSDHVGTISLQTDRQGLCEAHPSTASWKSWPALLLMQSHHTQTYGSNATLLRTHVYHVCKLLYQFRHICPTLLYLRFFNKMNIIRQFLIAISWHDFTEFHGNLSI